MRRALSMPNGTHVVDAAMEFHVERQWITCGKDANDDAAD